MARRRRAPAGGRPAAPAAPPSGIAVWLAPACVVAITVVAFLPSLDGQFLNWDDDRNFLMNPAYRGLGWPQLQWMFTTFHLGPYQPLSWMTLGLDFVVWGMDPFGYHLTNLMLHAVNAWLVYLLAIRFFRLADRGAGADGAGEPASAGHRVAAAAAALLFSVHPLRVESVAWITERRDVLSGLFFLLTLLAYTRAVAAIRAGERARGWMAAAASCFALSLLSKATAMALPAALLVLDWWLLGRVRLLNKLPFVVVSGAALVVAAIGQRTVEVVASIDPQGFLARVGRAFYGIVFYLGKSIAPVRLSNLYEVPFRADAFDWHFLAAAVLVLAVSVVAFTLRRRVPAVLTAWASYGFLMLPVSGIAHGGGQILADRYSYLPGMTLALLAGAGVLMLWRAAGGARRAAWAKAAFAGVAAVLVVLGALTSRQTRVWHDSLSLWQHALAQHPIERLRASGAARAAEVRAYETALAGLGDMSAYWVINYNLGTTFREQARTTEAVVAFERAARVNPENADVRNSWGASLMDLRRYDEAAGPLEEAIRLEPSRAEAHYNLGVVRTLQRRPADAIAVYRNAIRLNAATAELHYNLGVLLADAGQLPEAEAEYRRAVSLRPNYSEAFNNLGVALGRQGRTAEAVEAFRRAVALEPANDSARGNLAAALKLLSGRN